MPNIINTLVIYIITLIYSDGEELMLSPENSIKIQNAIGADIIMQLDDVIKTTSTGPRVEEATYR